MGAICSTDPADGGTVSGTLVSSTGLPIHCDFGLHEEGTLGLNHQLQGLSSHILEQSKAARQVQRNSRRLRQNVLVRDTAGELESCGFTRIAGPLGTAHDADEASISLVDTCRRRNGLPPLSIIGDFVVPPLDAGETRDFQTLHFDFGLPLDPKTEQEVARYTALYVPAGVTGVRAVTRLVPLMTLFSQRPWPPPGELVDRLTSYGRTHGSWDDDQGYVEGSLARIVEGASAWRSPFLPSVKQDPGFLCGLEFDSLFAELAFFARHGLRIDQVEISVDLGPGELLVFDNLAVAHGRRGRRKPGELRQRMFGHRLGPAALRKLRDSVLMAFYAGQSEEPVRATSSIP
jgi:Taurine catabolism dioxygenase TauD, TfdA family